MTYTFSARGPSKTDALLDFDAKLDKLVKDLPLHELDKDLISSHVRGSVSKIDDPDYTEDLVITVSGYMARVKCGREPSGEDKFRIVSVNHSVLVTLVVRR